MGHRSTSDFNISTQITQLGRDVSKQSGFVNAPVYRGSTVIFPTVDDLEHKRAEFHYGAVILEIVNRGHANDCQPGKCLELAGGCRRNGFIPLRAWGDRALSADDA